MKISHSLARTDEQLIADYFSGDRASLEVLIRSYLKPIYSFVFRRVGDSQEAEDITQEVFVRTWKHLKKFDKQKKFRAWLFSIAKNASIDFLKKKKNTSAGVSEKIIDQSPGPGEIFAQKDIALRLVSAIEKLSLECREIFYLRYRNDFTFSEIAEFLGEPPNTIRSRYRRALPVLKKLLTK
ncbi:MAG: sigma-70 family RNA polymerase sigma factor [bacterium]